MAGPRSLPRSGRRQFLKNPFTFAALTALAGTAAVSFLKAPEARATAWIKTNPQVRIRIVEAGVRTQVRGFDLRFFSYARDAVNPGAPSSRGRRPAAQVDRVSSWKLDCLGASAVRGTMIAPAPLSTQPISLAAPVLVESPSGFVSVEGRPYREKILIHPVKKNGRWTCELVNHVDIEKYLDGLVNAEFNAKWSREAIDAQVIAARTYAYYQMKVARERANSHFDLDSTIKDQVYDGSMREDYRASLAAERTRGIVLKASLRDSWPIKAYYHSTCGGTTELPEAVWGRKERGFTRRAHCPYCHESPSYLWDIPLNAKEVAHQIWVGARNLAAGEKVTRAWPEGWRAWLRDAQLMGMRTVTASPTGRVGKIVTEWKRGEKKFTLEIPATLFRFWVGTTKLKSTVFHILPAKGGTFVLRGRGYGHGVGLCQWGAKVAGEKGKTRDQILKLYYPDAVVARAW